MSGQASDANQELQAQVEFLQNLVFRLSHEVSRTTALSSPSSAALAKEETKRILEQLPEDLEVPEWLTSVDILSPLLRAFESHSNELKRNIEEGKERCQALEDEVQVVVEENSRLRQETVELTEKFVSRIQEQGLQPTRSLPENLDSRLDLLGRENDLLRTQNSKLNEEISDLHADLEAANEQLLATEEEKANKFDHLHTLQRDNNSFKAQIIDADAQIQDLRKQVDVLERRVVGKDGNGLEGGDSEGGAFITSPSGIKITQEKVNKTKLELSKAREENAQLAEEVSKQKSVLQAAALETTELRKQVVSLTELTSKLEIRNNELQSKDFDSLNLIQNLNDKIKQEQARNDIHSKTKVELEKEIKELHQQMKRQANGLRSNLKELYQTRMSVAESSARQAEELVSSLTKELGDAKALYERAQRDSDFHRTQLSEIKDLNRDHPTKLEELLKRIERTEEERDAAVHKASSKDAVIKRMEEDHERLTNTLSMEKERAQKLAQISSEESNKLKDQLVELQEVVKDSELSLQKVQKSESEFKALMTQKLDMQRTESDEQIKFLQKRLDNELDSKRDAVTAQFESRESDASAQSSRAEAEEAMRKYERMERQLRAESINFSRKLEAVNEEKAKLEGENAQVIRHLNILTQQNREAYGCISDAENELIALKERLKAAVSKEVQLLQEKEDAYNNLESIKLEVTKAQRAQNNSEKKVIFLRNQCETLQEALASSRIVPDRGISA